MLLPLASCDTPPSAAYVDNGASGALEGVLRGTRVDLDTREKSAGIVYSFCAIKGSYSAQEVGPAVADTGTRKFYEVTMTDPAAVDYKAWNTKADWQNNRPPVQTIRLTGQHAPNLDVKMRWYDVLRILNACTTLTIKGTRSKPDAGRELISIREDSLAGAQFPRRQAEAIVRRSLGLAD